MGLWGYQKSATGGGVVEERIGKGSSSFSTADGVLLIAGGTYTTIWMTFDSFSKSFYMTKKCEQTLFVKKI